MPNDRYESNAISNQPFLQPFNLFFWRYDYHVMLYAEGHPELEAIEALIHEGDGEKPLVWVIMTRHDQTQVDLVNDRVVAERTRASSTRKEVYHTDITYRRSVTGKPHISLSLVTPKGEDVVFDFHAVARPSTRRRGLIDPGSHSGASVLPVMYRENSTLASPASKLAIGGTTYAIPVKLAIPPFFRGMKGYYSEVFSLGGIGGGEVNYRLIRAPQSLAVEQDWLYEVSGSRLSYVVKETTAHRVTIQKSPDTFETISCVIADGHLEIAEIGLTSRVGNTGCFVLKFSPPLPDMLSLLEGHSFLSTFAFSIDGHSALVTGALEMARSGGATLLALKPLQPTWAKQRAVDITVSGEGSDYRTQSVLVNARKMT